MVFRSILDAIEVPTIVQLREGLFAAVFPLIKTIAARYVVRMAEQRGALGKNGQVFESTSGTMGLALAYVCRESGHPLTLVGDPVIGPGLRLQFEALGAQVVLVNQPQEEGGFQGARLAKLRELIHGVPGAFWTQQYDNPDFPDAYDSAGASISVAVPSVDFLVCAVATGGSSTGLIRALRAVGKPVRLVAVDTHHSVLFGQADGPRRLRGLGNSIIPRNLDYSLVDECHWVSAAEAFRSTYDLFRTHLLDVGPTSGATFKVASWIAARNPEANVVFVCADSGERYRDTVYNPAWLESQVSPGEGHTLEPHVIGHPAEAGETWCKMNWAGRPLTSVLQPGSYSASLAS